MQDLGNTLAAQEPAGRQEKHSLQDREDQPHHHATSSLPQKRGQHDHEEDHQEILKNGYAQGHARSRTVRHPQVLEGLDADGGAGERHHHREGNGHWHRNSKGQADSSCPQPHQSHLPTSPHQGNPAQVLHLLEGKLQTQGEEEKNDPQLRQTIKVA